MVLFKLGATYEATTQRHNPDYRRTNINNLRFEVFTAVTMKNGVFWVDGGARFLRNVGSYKSHTA
jgi:hypothetical protein